MAEQTVTYLIGKDGKITVEVNGVRGPACRELVKETVEKLGVELSVELKPEYFDQAEEKEQEKIPHRMFSNTAAEHPLSTSRITICRARRSRRSSMNLSA